MSLLRRVASRRLFQAGFLLFFVGSGPLLAIIAASKLGFTGDPNPNPVVFGIAAMLTFWPSLAMMGVALWSARRDESSSAV